MCRMKHLKNVIPILALTLFALACGPITSTENENPATQSAEIAQIDLAQEIEAGPCGQEPTILTILMSDMLRSLEPESFEAWCQTWSSPAKSANVPPMTAETLLHAILKNAPDCADRSTAIRCAREARMWANAAIALEPIPVVEDPTLGEGENATTYVRTGEGNVPIEHRVPSQTT